MKIRYTLLMTLIVMVNSVFAVNERTCPPCPYHPCPTDFITLIKKDVTISVPGILPIAPFTQVDTIQDALSALDNYKIASGVAVTIQLTQNATNYDTINITHADGDKIRVVGNCGGNSCTIQFKSGVHGFYVGGGNKLGFLDGFNLTGQQSDNANGIYAYEGGNIVCNSNMTVQNFSTGVFAEHHSYIYAPSVQSTHNSGAGIVASDGSTITAPNAVADYNKGDGILAEFSSSIKVANARVSNNGENGVNSEANSSIDATGTISKNNYWCGFRAAAGSYVRAPNCQANNNNIAGVGGVGQVAARFGGTIWAVGTTTQGEAVPFFSDTDGHVYH